MESKTPGREVANANDGAGKAEAGELPREVLVALGGKENIASLDACITRLRVQVNEQKNVNKDRLKELGAAGVLEVGNNIQAIFGPKSDTLKSQIHDIMSGRTPHVEKEEPVKVEETPQKLMKMKQLYHQSKEKSYQLQKYLTKYSQEK